MGTSASAQSG